MATVRMSILGVPGLPDTSSNVWREPASSTQTNHRYNQAVARFKDTSTKDSIGFRFLVPIDYAGQPVFEVIWTTTATTGNAVWACDYAAAAKTATLDPSADTENLTKTTAAPGSSQTGVSTRIAATGASIAAGNLCQGKVSRNGAGADTIAADLVVSDIIFEYSTTVSGGSGDLAPGGLSITTQPSASTPSATPFLQQPVIQLLDPGGNPISTAGVAVTAARNSGSDTLGGTLSKNTNASGVATFTDLMFTGSNGNTDTLVFSSSGRNSVVSNVITLANFATPDIINNAVFASWVSSFGNANWDGWIADGSYSKPPNSWLDSTVDMGGGVMTSAKLLWKSLVPTNPNIQQAVTGATSIGIQAATGFIASGTTLSYHDPGGGSQSVALTADVNINDTTANVTAFPTDMVADSTLVYHNMTLGVSIDTAGFNGPGNTTGYDDIYVRYYMKATAQIKGLAANPGGQKILRAQDSGFGNLATTVTSGQSTTGDAGFLFDQEDAGSGGTPAGSATTFPFTNAIYDGSLHYLEWHIARQPGGSNIPNAYAEFWQDGVQVTGTGSNTTGSWTNSGTRWTTNSRSTSNKIGKIVNFWTWNPTTINFGQINISRYCVSTQRIGS
jgi:hypothetical protein